MIKVLVVEDSPVIAEFLVYILNSAPGIQVVGVARDGEEAIEAVDRKKPDVITMDIHMPKMNGFEATRKIMETTPTPIIIVSGTADVKELETTFQAMEAGAIAALPRPQSIGHPSHEQMAEELIQTVTLMSEVKVVKRWARARRKEAAHTAQPSLNIKKSLIEIKMVVIGASTGGPVVIHNLLANLPKDFPAPILIVQHMAPGFISGFAQWLTQSSGFPAHVATHGEYTLPGHAYIAPDGSQMGVGVGNRIILRKGEAENGLCPSVSYLFRSVAHTFGQDAIGVLLTGMGKDGAEELRLMKEKGAITIAQDKESSAVHGMPGEAIKQNGATYVLSPDKIAAALAGLVNKRLGS